MTSPRQTEFQAVDWQADDVPESDCPDDLLEGGGEGHDYHGETGTLYKNGEKHVFAPAVFGRCADGRTVALRMHGFRPYFYVGLRGMDQCRLSGFAAALLDEVNERMPRFMRAELRGIGVCRRKRFFGFDNERAREYFKLTFDSMRAWRVAASRLRKDPVLLNGARRRADLYESQTEPLLKMIHARGLPTVGWMSVLKPDEMGPRTWGRADVCADVMYTAVVPLPDRIDVAPLVVSSFDIECYSMSGVFPVAKKDYGIVCDNVKEILSSASHQNVPASAWPALVRGGVLVSLGLPLPLPSLGHTSDAHRPQEDRNQARSSRAQGVAEASRACPPSVLRNRRLHAVTCKRRPAEAAVLEALSDDHVRDIIAYLRGDVNYAKKSSSIDNAKRVMDAVLPPLEGDPIIQIGLTDNTLLGAVSRRWIGVLGTCATDKLAADGVEVESVDTEAELLLAFARAVVRSDPDVLTGWNVFGFDFKYLYDRATELGVADAFLRDLGRMRGKPAAFTEKKLSSSALGDNEFYYIDMHGRVLMDLMSEVKRDYKRESYKLNSVAEDMIGESKADLLPADIFRLNRGTAEDRGVIAEYCVQDCALCNRLAERCKTVLDRAAMATLSHVPLRFVILRGQSIKVQSLVANECLKCKTIILELPRDGVALPLQGATVMDPKRGFYDATPIGVLDFASLYPSLILSEDICPSRRVTDPAAMRDAMRDCPDAWDFVERTLDGKKVTFAAAKDGALGIVPRIETKLLAARKRARGMIEVVSVTLLDGEVLEGRVKAFVDADDELTVTKSDGSTVVVRRDRVAQIVDRYDAQQKDIFDLQQKNYKVLANSVYGQLGASTGAIYDPYCAMAITDSGRRRLQEAAEFARAAGADVIYGDTDSIFIAVPALGTGDEALRKMDVFAADLARRFTAECLRKPLELEYEKIYFPLLLLNRKRYVGVLHAPGAGAPGAKAPKMCSMGLETKRRDNAPIVRRVMDTCLNKLMVDRDLSAALAATRDILEDVAMGRVPLDELIITKTLRAMYVVEPPHKVLAERMGDRDPGSKPQINDRVPFVYVRVPAAGGKRKIKQCERVEDPEHVKRHRLSPDYAFYMENQIMKPMMRVLAAVLERLPGYHHSPDHWHAMAAALARSDRGMTPDAVHKRVDAERESEARRLFFDPLLARADRQHSIKEFFGAAT